MNSCKDNSKAKTAEKQIVSKNYQKIAQLEWLVGTWTNESAAEFSQETWSKENDSTYTGFSFTEAGGKTIFAETMALEEKANNLQLTVVTANKNGALPVTFKLISSDSGVYTFENKEHDFPKRITYTNPIKDSLHAWIEGNLNGKIKKTDFYFSRN